MKKKTDKLEHESKYHNAVGKFLRETYGLNEYWAEVKLCKTKTFSHNSIRLNQKAMLANPNPVWIHIPDTAMDFGQSRGLDLVCAESKYLCIVHLHDNQPRVIPIFMNDQSRIILKESQKLQYLIDEFGSYPLS